jgi:hypothetical protein
MWGSPGALVSNVQSYFGNLRAESDRPIIRVYKKVQRNKEGRLVGRPEAPYLSTELVCLANPSFADNDHQPLPDEIVPTDFASIVVPEPEFKVWVVRGRFFERGKSAVDFNWKRRHVNQEKISLDQRPVGLSGLGAFALGS